MNISNVFPLRSFLFLSPVTAQTEINGIVTPSGKPYPNVGQILKIGKEANHKLQVGQKVFFKSEDKESVAIGNEVYYFVDSNKVIGKVDEGGTSGKAV